MAYEPNTVDAFLQHRTTERSGAFLKDWKKNTPPKIDTWMSCRRMPIALWQHPFPKVVVRDVSGESKTEIWGGQYNCWETEDILKTQYHRNDDGSRRKFPKRCPQCRLVESVRDMIEEGQLDWLAKIFTFEGDDDKRVIHAGGICGMFNDRDLEDEKKEQMKKAGIRLTVPRGGSGQAAWMENGYAKCSYLFLVVDNNNVAGGLQKTIVPSLLGDKVKEVVNDTISSLGDEEGNPWMHPYAIQWEHRPSETEFQKKYKARRMEKLPLTDEIAQLIRGEVPDLSMDLAPFNMATMRAFLEKHALIDLPWDFIFDVEKPAAAAKESPKPQGRPALPGGPARGAQARQPAPAADIPDEEPETVSSEAGEEEDECPACHKTEAGGCPHFACDGLNGEGGCGEPMLESDAKCAACGFVYREEAPTPKPTGRKRSTATKETGTKPPFA